MMPALAVKVSVTIPPAASEEVVPKLKFTRTRLIAPGSVLYGVRVAGIKAVVTGAVVVPVTSAVLVVKLLLVTAFSCRKLNRRVASATVPPIVGKKSSICMPVAGPVPRLRKAMVYWAVPPRTLVGVVVVF